MGTQHDSEIWLGEVNYCAMGFSASCMWVNRAGCLMPNQKWILINSQTCGPLSQLASGHSRSWNCGTLGCRDLIIQQRRRQNTNTRRHTTCWTCISSVSRSADTMLMENIYEMSTIPRRLSPQLVSFRAPTPVNFSVSFNSASLVLRIRVSTGLFWTKAATFWLKIK